MSSDGSSESALLAAVAMANNEAQATYQAALKSSENAAKATTEAAQTRADADRDVAQTGADAQRDVAQTESTWRQSNADKEKDAAEHTADKNAEAAKEVADKVLQWQEYSADKSKEAAEKVAETEKDWQYHAADARKDADEHVADRAATAQEHVGDRTAQATEHAADAQRDATEHAADAQKEATIQASVNQKDATIQAATIDAGWHQGVANVEANSRVQAATIDASWHSQVATIELTGTEFTASQQLAGVQTHENAESGRLNTKLGFALGIYNDIKPVIQQIVGSITAPGGILGGGSPGFNPTGQAFTPEPKASLGFHMRAAEPGGRVTGACGGDSLGSHSVRPLGPPPAYMGPLDPPTDGGQASGGATLATAVTLAAPYIAARGVLTPAMLQQQINQAYSRNDARTQTQIRKAQGDLAGRGFSSNSPILDALKVGYVTSNLRASIEGASQIRLQAAQANVDAVFRGQQARSEQYIGQEKVALEAQHNTIEQTVGILNAVASLVGGIL